MKCEKCEKEATFHYQSVINGEKTEYHLCADCAKEQGLDNIFSFNTEPMFESLMSAPFGSVLSEFFRTPFGGMFGGRMLSPTLTMPRFALKEQESEASTEAVQEKTDNIPEDAGEAIRSRRELIALKHQLRNAVRAEDYEKAIELRDKIKDMEK